MSVKDLPITPVNPDSSIPLYYQIETDLRRLISSGQLAPGSTLPPELELCQAYGVGRHTMRVALSRLAADDLIARYAGRGTFVKAQPDRTKFYLDRSFTRQMAELGLEAHSKVLEISTKVITEHAPEPLRQKIGTPCLHLVRLRFGGSEPIGIQSAMIPTELCPGLETVDFSQNSLYEVLATKYRLLIAAIHHTVSATVADELQAGLLQIAKGAPLLVVNTTAFLEDHEVIEYSTSYYRADKYEFSTTHTYSPCD